MTNTHSHAPWKIVHAFGIHAVVDGANVKILDFGSELPSEDAALICAAPELLEACKLALSHLSALSFTHPHLDNHSLVTFISAAIAKATTPLT